MTGSPSSFPPAASTAARAGRLASRVADVVVVATLAALALGVLYDPESGEAADRRLRWAVAALAGSTAILWILLQWTRRTLAEVGELLADVRFGSGTRRDREAVDILVRALRTPEAAVRETALRQLRRITGQDLGDDPGAWAKWWAAARGGFSRGGDAGPASANAKGGSGG